MRDRCLLVALSLMLGCGSANNPPAVDAAPLPDAGTCTAPPAYAQGSDGEATEYADGGPTGMRRIVAAMELPSPGAPDFLILDLKADRGVFAGGDIDPGTYTLQGAETKFSTCGICVIVGTDEHPADNSERTFDAWYFARAGTVTLTRTTGRLTGSLSNISLVHVATDRSQHPLGLPGDMAADDCTTTIPSLTFDFPLAL